MTYFAYLDEFGHIGPYISRTDPRYNDSPVFGLAGFVLPERQGARAVLGFQGLTGPRRNPRGEAGEEIVAGELCPGPSVGAAGLREPFDPIGHVGQVHRPLRVGRGPEPRRWRGVIVLREISVVSGQMPIAMSALKAFSSMFIGGRPEI